MNETSEYNPEDLKDLPIQALEMLLIEARNWRLEWKKRQQCVAHALDAKRRNADLQEDLKRIGEKHGVQLLAPQSIRSEESVQAPNAGDSA